MLEWNSDNDYPEVDKTAHVHATAVLIGKVKVGKNGFIGPGAVLRADEPESQIIIGDDCNIQDRVVIHALKGSAVNVGPRSSLSHGCIVHGPCEIGGGSFVGFGSVVFCSVLKEKVFVGHLSSVVGVNVPSGRSVPDHCKIGNGPNVKALEAVSKQQEEFMAGVIQMNKSLVRKYNGFLSES